MKNICKKITLVFLCVIMCTMSFSSCNNVPYDYDLNEYITVPSDLSAVTVTDAEIRAGIDKTVNSILDNKAIKIKETEIGIREGHVLNISFKCYQLEEDENGKPIEITILSDNACTLVIGEDEKYPQDLQFALIRKIAGESFDAIVKLPSSFTALGLAGEKIRYVGQIQEVYRVERPEYNDDFVKLISKYQTVEEYEAYLYEKIKEELIFEKLLELAGEPKAYPTNELQAYTDSFAKYYTEQANALGISLEEYVNKKFFITITEFYKKEDTYSKQLVAKELLLYSLARKYGIDVSDAEYASGASKYAAQYGFDTVQQFEAKFGSSNIRQTLLMDEVLVYLSRLVEVTVEPEQPQE